MRRCCPACRERCCLRLLRLPAAVRLVPNGIFSAVSQQDEYNVSYVYDDKTTLDYSLTYTGVKENIVVREYTGRTAYEFTLYTGGLELKNSDGSYYLADENGEKWGSIGDIIIFTADGKNNTVSRMTHETVVPCEQYTITVHVDDQYLRDEKTVYPIRIDPMIEISYNTYGAIAFDDATINSDNTMDGTGNILYIGKRDGVKSRVIMRIREGRLGDIPSTRHVNAASVYMTNVSAGINYLDFTPMNVMTYMYSGSDWDDTSTRISSGNFDSYAHYMSARDVDTPYQRYGFDITNAVKFWMMNEHFTLDQGLLLKAPDTVENGSEDLYKAFAYTNTLRHELLHSVGAYDHYHEMLENEDGTEYCKAGDKCSVCYPDENTTRCVMFSSNCSELCSKCKNYMSDYLSACSSFYK